MKKFILCLSYLMASGILLAQNFAESYTYESGQYIPSCLGLPVVRNICGGTIFQVTYEGDEWDNQKKAAFEYACKIWEENLPTTLPIKITARIGDIRQSSSAKQKILSKVSTRCYEDCGSFSPAIMSSSPQIKAVLLEEYNVGYHSQFVGTLHYAFFEMADIILTYNSACLNDFSYSIDETPTDKYDFVTLVLRDIAKGLGFNWSFPATEKQLQWMENRLTPYEYRIASGLGKDPKAAYVNATKGSYTLSVEKYGNLQLYAPQEWQNGISLCSFIPDETKGITQLLTYKWGKGTIVRNISDDYKVLTKNALDWFPAIIVGGMSGSALSVGSSTIDVVPYKGTIETNLNKNKQILSKNNKCGIVKSKSLLEENLLESSDIDAYCLPYYPFIDMKGEWGSEGWKIALLKKDGTWDVVYTILPISNLTVSTTAFQLHAAIEEYARSCDGFLRCRISYCEDQWDNINQKVVRVGRSQYVLLDYLPQKATVDFIEVLPELSAIRKASTDGYDDYSYEAKLGLKNVEGATRVVVEILTEGTRVPFKMEIPNFKEGAFVATFDKEFSAKVTPVSYNKNGSTRGETLTVLPISEQQLSFDIQLKGNTIEVECLRKSEIENIVDYSVYNLLDKHSKVAILSGAFKDRSKIDVSSLSPGIYVLSLRDAYGKAHMKKFMMK